MPKSKQLGDQEVQMDRRWKNRRSEDRTEETAVLESEPESTELSDQQVGGEGESETKPPRRKKQRRRQIDPTTCERDYNDEEILFMQALDEYKRSSGRMFPTCSEILEVVRALGYTKLTEEEQVLLDSIKDVDAEMEQMMDGAITTGDVDVEDLELESLVEGPVA